MCVDNETEGVTVDVKILFLAQILRIGILYKSMRLIVVRYREATFGY